MPLPIFPRSRRWKSCQSLATNPKKSHGTDRQDEVEKSDIKVSKKTRSKGTKDVKLNQTKNPSKQRLVKSSETSTGAARVSKKPRKFSDEQQQLWQRIRRLQKLEKSMGREAAEPLPAFTSGGNTITMSNGLIPDEENSDKDFQNQRRPWWA